MMFVVSVEVVNDDLPLCGHYYINIIYTKVNPDSGLFVSEQPTGRIS